MFTLWKTTSGRFIFRNFILSDKQARKLLYYRPTMPVEYCRRDGLRDYYKVPKENDIRELHWDVVRDWERELKNELTNI